MLSTSSKLALLSLLLAPLAAKAQEPAPRRAEASWQHANGVWVGRQQAEGSKGTQTSFLIDNGSLSLNRSDESRRNASDITWTLGLGEKLDRFVELEGQSSWQRTLQRHRLSLNLNASASAFLGSTAFADLDDQFLLTNGFSQGGTQQVTSRWNTDLAVADSVALTRSVDLNLDANQQEAQLKIAGDRQNENKVSSFGVELEKRWVIGSLNLSSRRTELELGDDLSGQNLRTDQNVLDSNARLTLPLIGRLSGLLGWQDIIARSPDTADRRLSGPELGLVYAPLTAWSADMSVQALRDQSEGGSQQQLFGDANLGWRRDARNSFTLGVSKQIDLVSSFRTFTVENIRSTDQQQSTNSTQLQWAHQRGRYQATLGVQENRQDFAQSRADFTELTLNQSYDVSRRAQLSASLEARRSRFKAEAPAVAIRRNSGAARLAWQEALPGSLTALGGRLFYRTDLSVEDLQEEVTGLRVKRLTLLLSLGQLGNF